MPDGKPTVACVTSLWPRTLSVVLTYRCTAQCNDCGTFSSPFDRTRISADNAKSVISQAASLGFANVVFTGGEATLEWESLLESIDHASSLSLPTRLVTNGHWGEDAASHVSQLTQVGLKEINFSTGTEHVRFVPLQTLIKACQEAAYHMPTSLMFEIREEGRMSRADLDGAILRMAPDLYTMPNFRVVESPWMPLNPSSPGYSAHLNATRQNVDARKGCDSVLQTYVLQANGVVASCCGLGMRKIKELQHLSFKDDKALHGSIEQAERDLVKWALSALGPERLVAWAAERDPSIEWEGRYAHRCHACIRMYEDPKISAVIKAGADSLAAETIFQLAAKEAAIPAVFR